jgi:hypothetical protein
MGKITYEEGKKIGICTYENIGKKWQKKVFRR